MTQRLSFVVLPLAVALFAPAGSAQQRIEFQRHKFDRSRFEHATQPATAPAPVPATTPAMPEPAEPVGAPPPAPDEFGLRTNAAPAAPMDTSVFSSNAVLPARPPPGGPARPVGLTPEQQAIFDAPLWDDVPAKWFGNAKDHDELVELQKKTGACLLVYFKNFAVPNEKGLCSWFEKSITTDIKWRKAMKYYLKLEINVPGASAVEELAARYRVGKTPALFVVKPGETQGTRLQVFKYAPGMRPEPLEIEQVLAALKTASTPAYQPLF